MKRLFWLSGDPVPWLFVLLDSIPDTGLSKPFEDAVAVGLLALGYSVKHNCIVPDRGDGYRGKVDFVAWRGYERIALELDREKPRKKSIVKVQQVPYTTTRLVYCRTAVEIAGNKQNT